MLDDKADYRFVTEYAMRNILVEGKPYCYRHYMRRQELPMLGEDVAFMRESILERLYSADGFSESIGTPDRRAFENTPESQFLPTYDIYNERIRMVRDTVTDEYDLIKSMMAGCVHGKGFIDRRKLGFISQPGVLFESTGEAGGQRSLAEVKSTKDRFDSYIKDLDDELSAFVREKEAIRDAALSEERRRWGFSGEDVKKPYLDVMNQSIAQAELEKSTSTATEEATHLANVEKIKGEVGPAPWQKEEALNAENERHVFALDSIANLCSSKTALAQRTYKKEEIDLEDEHERLMTDPVDVCKSAIDVKTADIEQRRSFLLGQRDETISALLQYVPELWEQVTLFVLGYGCNEIWRTRLESVYNTVISRSCADKWYGRNPLYKRATTPLDRLYADLERMNTLLVFHKGYEGLLWNDDYREERKPYFNTFRISPTEWRYTPTEGSGDPYDYFFDETEAIGTRVSDEGEGNRLTNAPELYFYYGRRYELEGIEKIQADVLFRRVAMHQTPGKSEAVSSAISDEYNNLKKDVDERYLSFDPTLNRFAFDDHGELTESERLLAEAKVSTANGNLASQLANIERDYPMLYGVRLFSRTLDFELKDIPSQSYLEEIDEITDDMNEAVALLEDSFRSEQKTILAEFSSSRDSIQKSYDATVEGLKGEHAIRLKAANEVRTTTLHPVGIRVNSNLITWYRQTGHYPTPEEEMTIWAPFFEAQASAESAYENAKWVSENILNGGIDQAKTTLNSALHGAEQARDESLSRLREKYYGNSGLVTVRKNQAKEWIKDVIDRRNEERRDINEKCQNTITQAVNAANLTMEGITSRGIDICNRVGTDWDMIPQSDSGIFYYTFTATSGASSAQKDSVNEANALVRSTIDPLKANVASVRYEAEKNRAYERSNCPPITLDSRGRFSCALPELDEPLFNHTVEESDGCSVIGIANIIVHASHKTDTGLPFDRYYMELERG